MAQRVIVLIMAIAVGTPLAVRAQAVKHPDFSGAWKVTNIDMPEPSGGGLQGDRGRGGFGGGGRGGFGRRGGGGFGGRRAQGNGDPNDASGIPPARPQRLTGSDDSHPANQ